MCCVRLLGARQYGKYVYYRLTDDAMLHPRAAVRRIAENQSAEVDRLVCACCNKRDSFESVLRAELVKLMRAGTLTVPGVRPEEEHALDHPTGVLNMMLRELEWRIAGLPVEEGIRA
jgi:DNA-binding transcriptional regulator PaaX